MKKLKTQNSTENAHSIITDREAEKNAPAEMYAQDSTEKHRHKKLATTKTRHSQTSLSAPVSQCR